MIKKILSILFLIVLCSAALAGTINPLESDESYLSFGNKFKCVGKVSGKYKNGQYFIASGVAIDDHNVLTAAHVVKESISCSFIQHCGESICFDQVIFHKDFKEEEFGKYDIAICYSKKSLNLDSYPQLYVLADEVNKECEIAGYGFYGTFITGAEKSDLKIRAGTNTIDSIERDLLICTASIANDPKLTKLEFLIASGDSGGGLFIDSKLAGINSCVSATDKKPNSSYSDEGGHTRISKYIDWIDKHRVR